MLLSSEMLNLFPNYTALPIGLKMDPQVHNYNAYLHLKEIVKTILLFHYFSSLPQEWRFQIIFLRFKSY